MGAVKRDINLKERQLRIRYQLTDPQAVKRLLSAYDDMADKRYWEGTAFSDILLDLNIAIEKANLTDKQKIALWYGAHESGYTWEDASKVTGMTARTLQRCEFLALRKIASVFEYWGNIGEGYEAIMYKSLDPVWASYQVPTESGSYVIIKHGKGLRVK